MKGKIDMLKIEKFVTMSPAQYEIIIDGMRNPKNSWDRSDSYTTPICDKNTMETADFACSWTITIISWQRAC